MDAVDAGFDSTAIKQLVGEMEQLGDSETQVGRLNRKLRENPFLGVGMIGLVTAVTLGAMRFNRRPLYMSASQYLMQMRVIAQGTVVGSLAMGMAYKLLRRSPLIVRAEGSQEGQPLWCQVSERRAEEERLLSLLDMVERN